MKILQVVDEDIAFGVGDLDSVLGSIKLDPVSPTTCHRFGVSSKLCYPRR